MADLTVEALYEQVRAHAPANTADAPPVLAQVAPGIRVLALRTPTLPPAAHTNVYLVGPAEGPVTVVDPGSPYPDQQAALDAVIADVGLSRVVLTHHHGDHVGGAAALAARWGAPIAAHARTAARLAGRVTVDELLDDDDVRSGMRAVFTPGHADGHLCFVVGDSIIAGDMVAGIGTILVDPSEGDMALYLGSLERLLAESATMLLPAHGPAIADGHGKLREYLAHRRMREARVVAALTAAGDATARDLVPAVYGDTPPALWPLAERSLLAHLAKLAADEQAIERDGRWSSRARPL